MFLYQDFSTCSVRFFTPFIICYHLFEGVSNLLRKSAKYIPRHSLTQCGLASPLHTQISLDFAQHPRLCVCVCVCGGPLWSSMTLLATYFLVSFLRTSSIKILSLVKGQNRYTLDVHCTRLKTVFRQIFYKYFLIFEGKGCLFQLRACLTQFLMCTH